MITLAPEGPAGSKHIVDLSQLEKGCASRIRPLAAAFGANTNSHIAALFHRFCGQQLHRVVQQKVNSGM